MKTVKNFENWTGLDVDTATSLFEYGIMLNENASENECNIVYGISVNNSGEYNRFTFSSIDWDDILSASWIKWTEVATFAGCEVSELQDFNIHNIHTLIQYYGNENVLGSNYDDGFQIVEEM